MTKTPKKIISDVPLTLERAAILLSQMQIRIEILERTLREHGIYL